jgi:carnosine N-methyltransferase
VYRIRPTDSLAISYVQLEKSLLLKTKRCPAVSYRGRTIRQYRRAAHYNVTHLRRQSFYSLPTRHLDVLSEPPLDLPGVFRRVDDAIDSNADIAEAIVNNGALMFNLDPTDELWHGAATSNDMDKARSTIKQLYRDWSASGLQERTASYAPILDALSSYLPCESPSKRHSRRVLVPGAGLCRLLFEIVNAGYTATGNEISYHQILASAYILNGVSTANQHTLYPWALNFSNHISRENQLEAVGIPDIHLAATLEATTPSEIHWSERMSMASGDFCVLYKQLMHRDSFHAVTTCFFVRISRYATAPSSNTD